MEDNVYKDEDEEADEESQVDWGNLIFLSFNPTFQLVVLLVVITKAIMGPLQSAYPLVYCSDVMDNDLYLELIKYFYWYCCDPIYCVDTVLHIIHRQVTDKAVRREYLPKSGFLLIVDIISLVPFFRLVIDEPCPPRQLYPNILTFTEFVIIYRVADYFSLQVTHSAAKLVVGFTIILVCYLNCLSCFWILLTENGLCASCKDDIYDWRNFILYKINKTDNQFATYVYASEFVFMHSFNNNSSDMRPSTILEFLTTTLFLMQTLLAILIYIYPKLFGESMLKLKRIFTFHPQVCRLVAETKRRNMSQSAHVNVEMFYSLLWNKRYGISCTPEILTRLPRYLRVEIEQDLCWPVFYHSPVLRNTSSAFRRMLCQYIIPDYKLPGEKFFSGVHSLTNLYYIKSGVVQIISGDDGVTPVLSVTSGTIFGDTSFLTPPTTRKILVRCLTYCEVLFLPRVDYLRTLHRHPEDRKITMEAAKQRMKHARTLFTCKQNVRGLDRCEDENIAWLKRRWWEISVSLQNWEKKSNKRDDRSKWQLPQDDCNYHCPKYIGQLVLCNETQLKKKSIFANVSFPWILVPDSSFGIIWEKIVVVTVFFVLLLYPPMLSMPLDIPNFYLFQFWANFVYMMDLIVSLLTAISYQEHFPTNFASVMFERCKTLNFALDVMATLWIEHILIIIGQPEYFRISQFNRLIKIYKLFTGIFQKWSSKTIPIVTVIYTLVLCQVSYLYISGFIVFLLNEEAENITNSYFNNLKNCDENNNCNLTDGNMLSVAIQWSLKIIFKPVPPNTMTDLFISTLNYYVNVIMSFFFTTTTIGALYLLYREETNFQDFVSNLKRYYKLNMIHKALLRRLDRYLMCHWKYYNGVDIMHPNQLKEEPYDIYWKVQGDVAETIIGESLAFEGANPALIRELAYAAKFLILPARTSILLLGVQSKMATWIVNGFVKCEYHNEEGALVSKFLTRGYMLSTNSVFYETASLRSYTAYTDCETLYIELQDLHKIIKQYPPEWAYIQNSVEKFRPQFENLFLNYMNQYVEYRRNLRRQVFTARLSTPVSRRGIKEKIKHKTSPFIVHKGIISPNSIMFQYWMIFRIIIVCISIFCAAFQGGSGAVIRRPLILMGWFCDCVAWIDIFLKMNMAYYDERGIVISNRWKCAFHYFTRGFLLDIIGAFPWYKSINILFNHEIDDNSSLLTNTICKFAHVYLVVGLFNYYANTPSFKAAYIVICKWQVIKLLTMLVVSHYLTCICIDFTFDDDGNLLSMTIKNSSWMPQSILFNVSSELTNADLHLVYAESLDRAQNRFIEMDIQSIAMNVVYFIGFAMIFFLYFNRYITFHSVAMLVLNFRGNILFQHGVNQLSKFLTAERVEKGVIHASVAHFTYWWRRTNGINIHYLSNERLGVVFRQDLNYYFYEKTFNAFGTIINAGKSLERQLASSCIQLYILPGSDIIREMDLTTSVYIIHRGKVLLSQSGDPIITLTRGCIFGQLEGTKPRPVRVTATAESYVDILLINLKTFQDLIDNKVRGIIKNSPQSQNDYLATEISYSEGPEDTVEYIIRRRETVRFPWSDDNLGDKNNAWYARWLYLAWFYEPVLCSFIVLTLETLPYEIIWDLYWVLGLLDIIHFANIFVEYYTIQLTVVGDKCVPRIVGLKMFAEWDFYIDIVSLSLPLLTILTNDWRYQLFRLLRLKYLYDFYQYFCTGFKNRFASIILIIALMLLMIHVMTCGWIFIACQYDTFPLPISQMSTEDIVLDRDEWVLPNERVGGCPRYSTMKENPSVRNLSSFVVPRHVENDYIVAISHIFLLFSRCIDPNSAEITIQQIYYNVFIQFVMFLITIWLVSMCISFVFTRIRELYSHDYNVNSLLKFLHQSGLAPAIMDSFKEYSKQLWRRQRGNWLPELAQSAPMCLKEDLLCALYYHHLETPPLLRRLPNYFLRQLAARLDRIVVFPDKYVVEEGDIFSCIYFIHEGEVEKWCKNKDGENRMISLLSTNGYFGMIPGLFPYVPFQYSYRTRTVVDFVVLKLRDWQDLLDGYPDVKKDLYAAAKLLKKELSR